MGEGVRCVGAGAHARGGETVRDGEGVREQHSSQKRMRKCQPPHCLVCTSMGPQCNKTVSTLNNPLTCSASRSVRV